MAHRGADAVGAGVAAADDDDVLALGGDEIAVLVPVEQRLGVGGEKLHREVDALEGARPSMGRSRGLVAPVQMTTASNSFRKICGSTFSPTLALQMNLMPSCSISLMRRRTTSFLSSFMFGMPYMSRPPGRSARSNTVTVWPALLSCAAAQRPAGPEPMTATFLPVRTFGGSGHDPAFVPALVDDRDFDVLDRDRRRVDAEHARAFARRGADAAGELGKIVRLVQALERLLPEAAIDEVVPLGDEVVDRAAAGHAADERAGVAERDAAIHAARALLRSFFSGMW